jgi:hypothetical protein
LKKIGIVFFLAMLFFGIAKPANAAVFNASYSAPLQVGPYSLTVEYNQWPIKAKKSLEMRIIPQTGITGMKASIEFIPPKSLNDKPIIKQLHAYPGVSDAWVMQFGGFPTQGEWSSKYMIDGPQGHAEIELPLLIDKPPGIPVWVGWLVGLIPLYGLLYLGWNEIRRVRKLQPQIEHQ